MASRQNWDRALASLVLGGGALVAWLALVEAPPVEGRTGFSATLAFKLFFFHVPIALVSFLGFGIALVASIRFLQTRGSEYDRAAHASIEVGVLYTAITLATGMIWGKADWGQAWRWDDVKLVLVLVLFLVYVAYLFLRHEIADPERRARISALYAIAGFATVPLAWFAQRIWATFHPTVFGTEAPDQGVVTPGYMPLFILACLVFGALFVYLFRWRSRLLHVEAHIEDLAVAQDVTA